MRYIISESQLDMVIPTPLKRRLDGLQELMYDVMMNNGMLLWKLMNTMMWKILLIM
jgi:hypothetical protein